MKTISLFFITFFVVVSFSGYSQVKVYDDNRVKIFGDRPGDDYDNDLSMQVFGKHGTYLTNGRIGFGDYGTKYSGLPNLFLGEFGSNTDSDILEIRGSNGVTLTHTQGYEYGHIIGSMRWISLNLTQRFEFNTDVYASGLLLSSDKRFKENIKDLPKIGNKLKSVQGVSYKLKADKSFNFSQVAAPTTDKEKKDWTELNQAKEHLKKLDRDRYGFVAQDLKRIFPELVEEDEEGYLYVDYLGLIPVLVETIKEQQQQLSILKTVLK